MSLFKTIRDYFQGATRVQQYLSGASFTLAAALLVVAGVRFDDPQPARSPGSECTRAGNLEARVDLARFHQLQGKEGISQAQVREILGDPYCTLPKLSLRFETITEREVYLDDSGTRAIVAYEDGQYLGYGLEDGDRPGRWRSAGDESAPTLRELELDRSWGIQAGDTIGDRQVVAALGEVSVRTRDRAYAPADGAVETQFVTALDGSLSGNSPDCVLFSSPQIPAYLPKICGLSAPKPGARQQGEAIGPADGYLHISLLSYRKTGDEAAKWVYVSPSEEFVEQLLRPAP